MNKTNFCSKKEIRLNFEKKAKKEAGIRKFTYIMFGSILVEGEEKNGGGFLMAKNFVNFEKSFITNRSSLRLFFCYYNCCYYKEAASTFWETFPTNFLPKNGHCSKRCFRRRPISVANFRCLKDGVKKSCKTRSNSKNFVKSTH